MTDLPVVTYGEGATFTRKCPICGRFTKANKTVKFNGDGQPVKKPNSRCKKCGRVEMSFVGYY